MGAATAGGLSFSSGASLELESCKAAVRPKLDPGQSWIQAGVGSRLELQSGDRSRSRVGVVQAGALLIVMKYFEFVYSQTQL